MKNIKFLLLSGVLFINSVCFGESHTDKILSLIGLQSQEAKPEDISSLLGQPAKIEQEKKQDIWYYSSPEANFVVYWNNRTSKLDKLSFSSQNATKSTWDNRNTRYLKTGQTHMADVIKALGVPKDMVLKLVNQELHYSYQNTVLNLFFRKGTLVNYCLY
jgi:hypothetical protein